MNMSVSIPSNLQPFVEQEIASGAVGNETELVSKALELYREMKDRHASLRADVQASLTQAEAGDVSPLDMNVIKETLRSELNDSDQPR